jgi:lysophospholipase L1-like esterase
MKIVITGSPDMSTPPRIPRLLRGLAGVRARAVNRNAQEVVKRHGLTFAPIAERTGPIFARDRTLFSADRFHPNNRGYAVWIPVLNEALDQALANQRSHCSP